MFLLCQVLHHLNAASFLLPTLPSSRAFLSFLETVAGSTAGHALYAPGLPQRIKPRRQFHQKIDVCFVHAAPLSKRACSAISCIGLMILRKYTIQRRINQVFSCYIRHLERRLPVSGRERCPGCHPERSEGSLCPASQTLRGVSPERSAWAQGDRHSLQMNPPVTFRSRFLRGSSAICRLLQIYHKFKSISASFQLHASYYRKSTSEQEMEIAYARH